MLGKYPGLVQYRKKNELTLNTTFLFTFNPNHEIGKIMEKTKQKQNKTFPVNIIQSRISGWVISSFLSRWDFWVMFGLTMTQKHQCHSESPRIRTPNNKHLSDKMDSTGSLWKNESHSWQHRLFQYWWLRPVTVINKYTHCVCIPENTLSEVMFFLSCYNSSHHHSDLFSRGPVSHCPHCHTHTSHL